MYTYIIYIYIYMYIYEVNVAEKNGHETDLEMSSRPLGTSVFEATYIRTMGK